MEPAGGVVVGVDGSEGARHALAWALGEAVVREVPLTVLTTWEPPVLVADVGSLAGTIDPAPFEEAARRVVAEETALALAAAATPPPAVTTEAVLGSASTVLRTRAGAADLLVVGRRGRGGFAGLLLGSVSQRCIEHAPCPVAVIPADAPPPGGGEVVVGVDGSAGADVALRWAAAEAGLRQARLAVVHTWWTPVAVPPEGLAIAPRDAAAFVEQTNHALREATERVLADVDPRPAEIELVPIEAPATGGLLQRAAGADLLVVGSRGRGGFAGLLLGSVSQQCAEHAPCPVAVVPPT